MSILVRDATVIAIDPEHGTEPWHADILVEGDSIAAIRPGLDAEGADVIEAGRRELTGRL